MKRVFLLLITLVLFIVFNNGRSFWVPIMNRVKGGKSINEVVEIHQKSVKQRLVPVFEERGESYPPSEIAILAVKEDRVLELWVKGNDENWSYICKYPILAASGTLGPKLREGDFQVPEGVYGIEYLNPNSSFYLSMKLNYPNEFDKKWAAIESRHNPGSDIFIHGKDVSVGCLAIGDSAIEELFLLVHEVGQSSVTVVISPVDPRTKILQKRVEDGEWVSDLYDEIRIRMLEITN